MGTLIGLGYGLHRPLPLDSDENKYLIAAQDPFGKWVEMRKTPSLRSWCAAEFLFDIIARWGTPHYIRTDNGPEFLGAFTQLC